MDAETGSRALHAANDLVEVLRLAQGAVERIVSREESASAGRGHPLRRASDQHPQLS